MFTLAVLCLMSGQDPRNRALPLIHFVTKVVSASAFAFLFFEKEKYFAYALAFVVEVFIALFLLYWLARLALANRKELSDGQSLQAGAYPSESTQTDITESYSPSNDLASSTEMEPSSFSSSQDDPKRDDDGSGSEDPSKFQAKGIPH